MKVRKLYWKARFGILARSGPRNGEAPDGLPVPGERLRFLISGIHDYPVAQFLEMGRLCHRRIQESLRAQGVELDQIGAILDFGCGCGRTIRNFVGLKNVRLEGTDYNPELIGWCLANLGFARFGLNRLEPPTSYADGAFDLVYAFSVFTHLPEPLQHAWMAELKRILKPGGYLAISTMPERMLLDPEGRAQFALGKLVVQNAGEAGANVHGIPSGRVHEGDARHGIRRAGVRTRRRWPGLLAAAQEGGAAALTGDAMRIEDRVRAVMSGVDRTIAPGDTMYTTDDHYFSVAASALRALLAAQESAGLSKPRRVLDFGCGYGRVMRTLRAAFPQAEILASDLDAGAVAHCATAFGARPVQTSTDIDRVERVRDIDLIWCGSILTHLDAPQWPRLLGYFAEDLAVGGVAVMTTCGRVVAWNLAHDTDYGLAPAARASMLASYRSRGFGYHDYPGQEGYGLSVSTPAWTVAQVVVLPSLRIIGYVEAGWDGHQDVLPVAKDADRLLKRV